MATDDISYQSDLPHTLFEFYASQHDKGVLLPRLTSAQRQSIVPQVAEASLLVYDLDTGSFWFWDGQAWREIPNDVPATDSTRLSDQDQDTRITVEQSPDEDLVRIFVGGTQKWQLDQDGHLQLIGS